MAESASRDSGLFCVTGARCRMGCSIENRECEGFSESNYVKLKRELAAIRSERPLKMAYATPEAYAAVNPMGGPAVIFRAMAARIEAGEDFYSVIDDYGLQAKPAERN